MKLDHKRTVLVGLAFFSICAFWQMYDNIIPLILTHTFQLDETVCGAIMAADNVLALFLLPFFGALSDRTSTRIGRRMPFILGGTACAVVLMNLLPLFDNGYAATGEKGKLVLFVVALGLLLVAMGTYRSPAVALMPDVTPKPLRSRANAIINLMGAVGGITYLLTAALLYPNSKTAGVQHVNYQPLFVAVSLLMAAAVAVLYFTTNEPKLAAAEKEYEAAHPEQQLLEEEPDGREELPKPVKRSLLMILFSIALWYIGYNGVTTWWTTYVARVMGQGLGGASTCLLVATGGAIVSYIPVGQLASRIGRKKTIQGGVLPLGVLPHDALSAHHGRDVCRVCARGSCVGGDQRQLAADGRGDVQGQRHRQVYGLLLHVLDGGAGRDADFGGHALKAHQLQRAVPVCLVLRGMQLCDDVLRAPRRLQGGGQRRPCGIRGHGRRLNEYKK